MRGPIGHRQKAMLEGAAAKGNSIALYSLARDYAGAAIRYDYTAAALALERRGLAIYHRSGGGISGKASWIEIIEDTYSDAELAEWDVNPELES